jgi:hypothetical protein
MPRILSVTSVYRTPQYMDYSLHRIESLPVHTWSDTPAKLWDHRTEHTRMSKHHFLSENSVIVHSSVLRLCSSNHREKVLRELFLPRPQRKNHPG